MNRLAAVGLLFETHSKDCKSIGVISEKHRGAWNQMAYLARDWGIEFDSRKSNGEEQIRVNGTVIYFMSLVSDWYRGMSFDLVYVDGDLDSNWLEQHIWPRTKELIRR